MPVVRRRRRHRCCCCQKSIWYAERAHTNCMSAVAVAAPAVRRYFMNGRMFVEARIQYSDSVVGRTFTGFQNLVRICLQHHFDRFSFVLSLSLSLTHSLIRLSHFIRVAFFLRLLLLLHFFCQFFLHFSSFHSLGSHFVSLRAAGNVQLICFAFFAFACVRVYEPTEPAAAISKRCSFGCCLSCNSL